MIRFGTDGIRGRVGDTITTEVAYAVGRAAGEVVAEGGRLCIGRDTRESGPELARAVDAGAAAAGAEVLHLGVVPTPVLAATTVRAAMPGCMITASHNPFHDNGLKLFTAEGLKLSADQERAVEERCNEVLASPPPGAAIDETRSVEVGDDARALIDAYVVSVLDAHAGLDLSGLRVGFDFAHGAGSRLGPQLFDRFKLGSAHYVGAEPDGVNINDGVGSTAPEALMAAVTDLQLDLAFAFDGDGDRVLAVTGDGTLVDGDEIVCILASHLLATDRLTERTVVVTNWSNLGLFKALAARDIEVVQTAVGDKHILEQLNLRGLSLGGEQSGHIILRDRATTGDGMLVAAELLAVVGRTGRSLADLAAEAMQRVPQVATAVRVGAAPADVVEALASVRAAQAAKLGDDGRIVLRASGTEPVVRVMAEAPTAEQAQAVVDELAQAVADHDAKGRE